MPTSFLLADPTAMNRPIVKVAIGNRPSLHDNYLGRKMPRNQIQAYRHVVAYALIARALKKCIRGLTPAQVRAWLSREAAWLDRERIEHDRRPLMINGELPNTQLGVQAALGAWLENATNWVENIKVGSADVNLYKGAAINPALTALKQSWKDELCDIRCVTSIKCIDVHTGEGVRCHGPNGIQQPNTNLAKLPSIKSEIEKNVPAGPTSTDRSQVFAPVNLSCVPGTTFEITLKDETVHWASAIEIRQGKLFMTSRTAFKSIEGAPTFALLAAAIDPEDLHEKGLTSSNLDKRRIKIWGEIEALETKLKSKPSKPVADKVDSKTPTKVTSEEADS